MTPPVTSQVVPEANVVVPPLNATVPAPLTVVSALRLPLAKSSVAPLATVKLSVPESVSPPLRTSVPETTLTTPLPVLFRAALMVVVPLPGFSVSVPVLLNVLVPELVHDSPFSIVSVAPAWLLNVLPFC